MMNRNEENLPHPLPGAQGLVAQELGFRYQSRWILQGASLQLQSGELVSLLGCNGAGKSTLLRLLLGLSTPAQGAIRLQGRRLNTYRAPELARLMAYVPQAHQPPFPYQVEEVVLLGRIPHGGLFRPPTTDDRRQAAEILARLGIAHLATRHYTQLSGGERQLVLIGRALAQGARYLIMDEPVNGLDYGNQYRLLATLRGLADEGLGILLTTHHPDHALFASHRVMLLEAGRISASGSPAQVVTPASIARLYGITVESHTTADGQILLAPRQQNRARCRRAG